VEQLRENIEDFYIKKGLHVPLALGIRLKQQTENYRRL
jgi:hypothetical protein